jgi:hypothetical protein
MLLASEIAELQTIAERSFNGVGTCAIRRPDPDDERLTDAESGQPIGDAPDPITVYAGDCYVDERGESIARMQGGDVDVDGKAVMKVPFGSGPYDSETDDVSATFNGVSRDARILDTIYLLSEVRLLVTWMTRAE